MTTESNPSIEELRARVDETYQAHRAATKALTDAQIAAARFQVGDVVEARRVGGGWAPAIVRVVEPSNFSTWYRVSFAKKDGTWSKAVVHAFRDVRPAGEGDER